MIVASAFLLLALTPAGAIRNIGAFALVTVAAASHLLGPDFAFRRAAAPPDGKPQPATDDGRAIVNLIVLAAMAIAALALVAPVVPARRPRARLAPDRRPRARSGARAAMGRSTTTTTRADTCSGSCPRSPNFVDGRQDPFPLSHVLASLDVERGRAPYRPLFDRWGIRCVFLSVKSPTARRSIATAGSRALRDDKYHGAVGAARGNGYFAPLSVAIDAESSLACTPGSTSGNTRAILPSGPTRNETRLVLPQIEFGTWYAFCAAPETSATKRERQRVLLLERLVARFGIARDAEDCHAGGDELVERVAECARFLGAAGRVVLRIEVDDRALPLLGGQLESRPLGVGAGHLGRDRAHRQQGLVGPRRLYHAA